MKGIWAIIGAGITALVTIGTQSAFAEASATACAAVLQRLAAAGFSGSEILAILARMGC